MKLLVLLLFIKFCTAYPQRVLPSAFGNAIHPSLGTSLQEVLGNSLQPVLIVLKETSGEVQQGIPIQVNNGNNGANFRIETHDASQQPTTFGNNENDQFTFIVSETPDSQEGTKSLAQSNAPFSNGISLLFQPPAKEAINASPLHIPNAVPILKSGSKTLPHPSDLSQTNGANSLSNPEIDLSDLENVDISVSSKGQNIKKTLQSSTSDGLEGIGFQIGDPACGGDRVLTADGSCMVPDIIRNVYVFNEPEQDKRDYLYDKLPVVPKPKIKYNLVIIRANEDDSEEEPIVIPPPLEKTVVLVLQKEGEKERKVIEIPVPPGETPEVVFINYKDGENPELPGNLDLRTALAHPSSEGKRISSSKDRLYNQRTRRLSKFLSGNPSLETALSFEKSLSDDSLGDDYFEEGTVVEDATFS